MSHQTLIKVYFKPSSQLLDHKPRDLNDLDKRLAIVSHFLVQASKLLINKKQ